MRFMKNLSPFTRCYPYSLSTLSNPITDTEFLAFIDRLNEVLVSLPIFQVAHITCGVLGSVQGVIPAQAIGGVLQVTSVLASTGVSYIRVRKFLKSVNADIFTPRGLVCKIMTTEKMMAAINVTEVNKKGKVKPTPLESVHDLGIPHSHSSPASISSGEIKTNSSFETMSRVKDPRLLRLQALEGYITPLKFDVPEPPPESWFSKVAQKPLRWINDRQIKGLEKAQEKSYKKRDSKTNAVSAVTLNSDNRIAEIDKKIEGLNCSQRSFIHKTEGSERLEKGKREEQEKREETVKKIYKQANKKMEKAYKREEKVVNIILWVVITKTDGSTVDEDALFRVDSDMTTSDARE